MKKFFLNTGPETLRPLFRVFVICAVLSMAAPHSIHAATTSAGNTVVRNYVSVAYKDANNNDQTAVTAYVDVTVTTVAAAPTVLSFSPTSGTTDGSGATQGYTVRIRTNSNGPGSISLAAADGTLTNISAGASPTISSPVFLGSTIIDPSESKIGSAQTVAAGSTITFAVPNDGGVPTDSATGSGATGDGTLNGLHSSDIVYVYDGTTYYGPFTVGTVTDPAVDTSSATVAPGSIVLTNASASSITFTPAYGWQILEAKDVTLTVTQGAITNPALAASWVTTVTATMSSYDGTGTVTTNAGMSRLSVTKEYSTDSGSTFTATPSSVAPSSTITYRITVTNVGTGTAKTVVLTDAQPVYTTYKTGTAKHHSGTGSTYASATALTDTGSDGDGYDFGGTTAGVATYSIAGTLSAGSSEQLFFQVTVN